MELIPQDHEQASFNVDPIGTDGTVFSGLQHLTNHVLIIIMFLK